MLFCRPLQATTKANDVFKTVATYFNYNDIKWEKLIGF